MSCFRSAHDGPAVKTGFHLSQYWVCQCCKEEISELEAHWANKAYEVRQQREAVPIGYSISAVEVQLELGLPPVYGPWTRANGYWRRSYTKDGVTYVECTLTDPATHPIP